MDNLTKLNTTPKGVQTRWGIGTVSSNIIDHCLQDSASAAEEYAKASEYLVNNQGLKPVHVADFDYKAYDNWAPKDDPLLIEAQSRAGGLKVGKSKEYKTRFDGGETIKNPAIHFWTGEYTITAIGHTRTDAKQKSTNPIGPGIFVDISHKSPIAQRAIILQTATYGNKETKDDKNVDSMEDAAAQAKAYWNIVMDLDPVADMSEPALQEHVEVRSSYDALSTDEEKEEYREQWHTSWMTKEFEYSFLRSTERTKIYKLAFEEGLYMPLKEDQWTTEEKAEVYESCWPKSEWDPDTWSIKEDAVSPVHQFEVGFATHDRNYRRIIEDLEWSRKVENPYSVEVMIFGNPKVMLPSTREKKIEAHIKKLTALNLHAKRSKWGLAPYTKVVFLQGLITEEDHSCGYEWNVQTKQFDKV
jgi:hypothetical protein